MKQRGLIKGGSDVLNYTTMDLKEDEFLWVHDVRWTGSGDGYIIQRVDRMSESRTGGVTDKKFKWSDWESPTKVSYYESWRLKGGTAFPCNRVKPGPKQSTDAAAFDGKECAYSEKILAPRIVPEGAIFNDRFRMEMDDDKLSTNMQRSAVIGTVYFIPMSSQKLMGWYEKFKNVATHFRTFKDGSSAMGLPACLTSEIDTPDAKPLIHRMDLAIGWHVLGDDFAVSTTGLPIPGTPSSRKGYLNLTSPHVRKRGVKLGSQVLHGGFNNLFRSSDFKYQDWFNVGK